MYRALFPLSAALLVACTSEQKPADTGDTGDGPDLDGDGYGALVDCDDEDPDIHPDAVEYCDGINNDCDAAIDEPDAVDTVTWYKDADLDGFGDPAVSTQSCERPPGFLSDGTDCDDTAPLAHPGAEEICNDGADNDCDNDSTDCVLTGELSLADVDAALPGDSAGDQAGASVLGTDLSGDGRADLVIGVPADDDGSTTDSGAVYVFSALLVEGDELSSADAILRHSERSSAAGSAVSAAGDVDGDGYGDLIIGAPGADSTHLDGGVAYLVAGPLSGAVSIEGHAQASFVGASSYDRLGSALVGGLDVSGDGVVDLIIGSERYGSSSDPYLGAAYLIAGPLSGAFDVEVFDARVTGVTRYDRIGSRLAGGDLDGDGLGDMIVGSWSYPSNAGLGVVGIFLGGVSGELTIADADILLEGATDNGNASQSMSIGDVDGDGRADLLVGAPYDVGVEEEAGAAYLLLGLPSGGLLSAVADATLQGMSDDDEAGTSVACDGDFDGDGHDDVLIGGPGELTVSRDAGRAYFFYGPLSGTRPLAEGDIVLAGAAGRQRAGSVVGLSSDVSGDGLSDIAIAAPEDDTGGSDAGMIYLLYGVGL